MCSNTQLAFLGVRTCGLDGCATHHYLIIDADKKGEKRREKEKKGEKRRKKEKKEVKRSKRSKKE